MKKLHFNRIASNVVELSQADGCAPPCRRQPLAPLTPCQQAHTHTTGKWWWWSKLLQPRFWNHAGFATHLTQCVGKFCRLESSGQLSLRKGPSTFQSVVGARVLWVLEHNDRGALCRLLLLLASGPSVRRPRPRSELPRSHTCTTVRKAQEQLHGRRARQRRLTCQCLLLLLPRPLEEPLAAPCGQAANESSRRESAQAAQRPKQQQPLKQQERRHRLAAHAMPMAVAHTHSHGRQEKLAHNAAAAAFTNACSLMFERKKERKRESERASEQARRTARAKESARGTCFLWPNSTSLSHLFN